MQKKRDFNEKIGANIKKEREKARLTQEGLSEIIGIGPKSLSAIERGTVGISLQVLCKICKTLSISSDSLLFGEVESNNTTEILARLEHLPPTQFKVIEEIILKLVEAVGLEWNEK